ncbi:MAG: hypothetical protein D6830_00140 [Ignavibacteria bacterium]|nr:MAG: hypothetical protein D6830_00140 [Ignavibacteria bacterium]
MNERFIYLNERYLSGEITAEEKEEFEKMISNNPELKKEFEDQKKVSEALKKMKLKNPEAEVWDAYWLGIYNRIERGLAWIIISIGAIIVLSYSIIESLQKFLEDNSISPIMKFGVLILAVGFVILIVSLIREKIFKAKRDKYKEIQR